MRKTVAVLVLGAVVGAAAAFTPPRLFGPPRTRAQALAYAKKAVFKEADKDSATTTPVPVKGSRQGRVGMMIDPGCVPGARPLSLAKDNALAGLMLAACDYRFCSGARLVPASRSGDVLLDPGHDHVPLG